MRIDPHARRPQLRGYTRRQLGALAGLDFSTIQQLAAAAGFPGSDAAVAAAIAIAESSGNPGVIGDRSLAPANGPSYGLWQINVGSKAHPEFAGWNLLDPATNATAAFQIYQRAGGSFGQWSTYTGQQYTAYLPADSAAPAPLTIDAATGEVIDDSTPTPAVTIGQGVGSSIGLALAVLGAIVLKDILE